MKFIKKIFLVLCVLSLALFSFVQYSAYKEKQNIFKKFIANPIPKSVRILSGSQSKWLDTLVRLNFITDEVTFKLFTKDYKKISKAQARWDGVSDINGTHTTFYLKTIEDMRQDTKRRLKYYLVRDADTNNVYFQHTVDYAAAKDKELPELNRGEIITFSDGTKEIETFINSNEFDSEYEKFDARGKLISKWNTKNEKWVNKRDFDEAGNLRAGPYKEFYKDGTLKMEGPYSEGKRNGQFKFYDEQGRLTCESNYREYELTGVTRCYHSNGNVEKEEYWDGTEHKLTIFDEQGKPQNGILKNYDKNGRLRFETSYKNGILDGMMKIYTSSGEEKVFAEKLYKDGKLISEKLFK